MPFDAAAGALSCCSDFKLMARATTEKPKNERAKRIFRLQIERAKLTYFFRTTKKLQIERAKDEMQTSQKKVAILPFLELFSHIFCDFPPHEPQYVLQRHDITS